MPWEVAVSIEDEREVKSEETHLSGQSQIGLPWRVSCRAFLTSRQLLAPDMAATVLEDDSSKRRKRRGGTRRKTGEYTDYICYSFPLNAVFL